MQVCHIFRYKDSKLIFFQRKVFLLLYWLWGSHVCGYEKYDLLGLMSCSLIEIHQNFRGVLVGVYRITQHFSPECYPQFFFVNFCVSLIFDGHIFLNCGQNYCTFFSDVWNKLTLLIFKDLASSTQKSGMLSLR
jgi:hypothetical protein